MDSQINQSLTLEFFTTDNSGTLRLPLFESTVPAGFPSLIDDHVALKLDLNKHLINHPSATFYARVKGCSMEDAGINDGDILIVDRALEPKENDAIVCMLDGEFTVKRVHLDEGVIFLQPAHKAYQPIRVTEDNSFRIWGVVTYVIHKL